jgi:hypothetical protein
MLRAGQTFLVRDPGHSHLQLLPGFIQLLPAVSVHLSFRRHDDTPGTVWKTSTGRSRGVASEALPWRESHNHNLLVNIRDFCSLIQSETYLFAAEPKRAGAGTPLRGVEVREYRWSEQWSSWIRVK